jgi:LPXTG-site transpeptidase (sortase) family protein
LLRSIAARARLRRRPSLGVGLIGVGALGVVIGAGVLLDTGYEAARFQASPEAAQAERSLEAPEPIWIDTPQPLTTVTAPAARPTPAAVVAAIANLQAADRADALLPTAAPEATEAPVAEPTEVPPRLDLTAAAFRFLDPPEPGARAQLTVTVHAATASDSTGAFDLALPLKWLSGYQIQKVSPRPADRQAVGAEQRLSFDELGPDETEDITVDLLATQEVLDAPDLRIVDANEHESGRAKPPTEAPHARPGPIWTVNLPRLNIRSGVVPVDWEPPLFVVGQLKNTPNVTQGNSVLVGHLVGSLGNVFQHLDRVNIGDEVIATSRGEQYRFVVSQKEVLPSDDTAPVQDTDTPRLTLMTCAGTWNPLARDYTDRLWVIAEPPELAAATIASGATAPRATPTSAPPTPTPAPPRPVVPISPPGGLGNTDVDLAGAYGAPVGEASGGLVVYHSWGAEYRAAFADVADPPARRALMVARVPAAGASFSLDEARKIGKDLLPLDAKPRGSGPEGNPRFAVERFTSAQLASAVPPQGYAEDQSNPGDLLVVYARQPDGRITDVIAGVGDNPDDLLRPFTAAASH